MQYFFDKHGRASKFSAQHIRQQPSPSSHCVDVTVNGVTVVSMVRGFTMADHHQDLPKQPHALASGCQKRIATGTAEKKRAGRKEKGFFVKITQST